MRKSAKFFVLAAVIGAVLAAGQFINTVNVRVAKIATVSGTVEVKRAGSDKWIAAEPDMRLSEGDNVRTKSRSKVVIQLDDGSMTQLTSLSEMKMEKLSRSLRGRSTDMGVDVGKSWMKVRKQSLASDKFNVSTPTAVAGVRGTYFSTEVEQTTDSTFDVFEGQIQVYQKTDPAESVDVRTNQRTAVKRGSGPATPGAIPADELKNGLNEGIEGGLDSNAGAYDLKIDVNPQVIPAGGKAVVTVNFLDNGKPYNGQVSFTLTLGGSAVFVENKSQTIEINSNDKGVARLEIMDNVSEQITINADVSFEVR